MVNGGGVVEVEVVVGVQSRFAAGGFWQGVVTFTQVAASSGQ